ncbi:MAG: protein TolQ [Candidatus Oxydemutatoraceae bacterium WSBS_2016_MAG_OTU14]
MQNDMDFFSLVASATLIVQLVMLVLLIMSVMSWTYIYSKWRELKKAKKVAENFEGRFWSGMDLTELYNELNDSERSFGLTAIFNTGFGEYLRLQREAQVSSEKVFDLSVRAMKVACSRECEAHENHLTFLATAGSTAPYIGLFGTVWGIMNAFLALRNVQQATLSLVAPGIAEALIATALGLVVAIPAVIAYNRFSDQADRLLSTYNNFIEEFTAILSKQTIEGEK